MSNLSPDGRSSMAVAMLWVNRITTISLEMVLPAGGGYWLDDRYGTSPWLMIVGAVLGFIVAMTHLLQIAKPKPKPPKSNSSKTP